MPTYDYKCTNCKYTFEAFHPMTADPLTDCPQCNGTLKRIIGSGTGPIFKGSGFYQTDYKNTKRSEVKNSKSATVSKKTKAKKKTK